MSRIARSHREPYTTGDMQAFLAQFPFSDQPKRFGALLAVAGGICLVAVLCGIALSPVPRQPTTEFTGGARAAVTLPAGATLTQSADLIDPLFPVEARALRQFSSDHPELATALAADHGGTLTLYAPTASGSAQFVLQLAGVNRDMLLPSLGRAFPKESPYRLPDNRIARELVADAEAAEAQLARVPGTDWLLYGTATSSLPLAFREDDGILEMTTFPVEQLLQISARFPSSRSFCLNGAAAVVPTRLESRWTTVRLPLPSFSLPTIAPRPRTTIPTDGTTGKYRNFCGILG